MFLNIQNQRKQAGDDGINNWQNMFHIGDKKKPKQFQEAIFEKLMISLNGTAFSWNPPECKSSYLKTHLFDTIQTVQNNCENFFRKKIL